MEKRKWLRNVKKLYHSGYWDGPMDGLCEYRGKIYRYFTFEDYYERKDKKRCYAIHEIEPWQLSYELYWHSLWVNSPIYKEDRYSEFEKGLVDERFENNMNFYELRKKEYKKIDYKDKKIIGYCLKFSR